MMTERDKLLLELRRAYRMGWRKATGIGSRIYRNIPLTPEIEKRLNDVLDDYFKHREDAR